MKRILIVEDEPEMRRNIATLLRYYDYEPIEAENYYAPADRPT